VATAKALTIDSEWLIFKPNLGVCILWIPKTQPGFLEQYKDALDQKRRVDILSWFLLTQVHKDLRMHQIRNRGSSTDRKARYTLKQIVRGHTAHTTSLTAIQWTLILMSETYDDKGVKIVFDIDTTSSYKTRTQMDLAQRAQLRDPIIHAQ